MRHDQQERAYRAEWAAIDDVYDAAEIRVTRFIRWLWGRAVGGSVDFTVVLLTEARSQSTFATDAKVQLALWAYTSPAWKFHVAHELAHVIVRRRDARIHHGPAWRREFLRLVRFFDMPVARRIAREFKRRGL